MLKIFSICAVKFKCIFMVLCHTFCKVYLKSFIAKRVYPFWSIWDIWDLSCWHITKIIRNFWNTFDHITSKIFLYNYTGWPPKIRNSRCSRFVGLCSDQQLSFFTLLDRASFHHYNNTKIIKFGWEFFISWVISYGLSFSGFAWFPEFRGTINDSFSSTCANTYQHSNQLQRNLSANGRAWIVNPC